MQLETGHKGLPLNLKDGAAFALGQGGCGFIELVVNFPESQLSPLLTGSILLKHFSSFY